MTTDEKIVDLETYFAERFPDRKVQIRPIDEDRRQQFWLDKTVPPYDYRRIAIPLAAIEDLSTGEITALLEHPAAQQLWNHRANAKALLALVYDLASGLDLVR